MGRVHHRPFKTNKEMDINKVNSIEEVQAKNYKRIFPYTMKRIQENKRLTKSDMAYQIGHIEPYNFASISYDFYTRDEIVTIFNQMFGTSIK